MTEIPNVSMSISYLDPDFYNLCFIGEHEEYHPDSAITECTVRSFSSVARSIIIEKNDAVKDCLRD